MKPELEINQKMSAKALFVSSFKFQVSSLSSPLVSSLALHPFPFKLIPSYD